MDTISGHVCACNEGYTGDGRHACVDTDSCAQGNHCGAGGDTRATCRDLPAPSSTYECLCTVPGFRAETAMFFDDGNGSMAATCADVDECAPGGASECHAEAVCHNTPGAYSCICRHGFEGPGARVPDGCRSMFFEASVAGLGPFEFVAEVPEDTPVGAYLGRLPVRRDQPSLTITIVDINIFANGGADEVPAPVSDGGGAGGDNAGQRAGGLFAVADSGRVVLAAALDREATAAYRITLSLSVGEVSVTATVVVTIRDANDNAPLFPLPAYTLVVAEDTPVGSELTSLPRATDADAGDNAVIDYSLGPRLGDNEGNIPFTVDPASGFLILTRRLDRGAVGAYNLELVASDRGTPPFRTRVPLVVVVGADAACKRMAQLPHGGCPPASACHPPGTCRRGGVCDHGEPLTGCSLGCTTVCPSSMTNGIEWPATACGRTAERPCPGASAIGSARRACDRNGAWAAVDAIACANTVLAALAESIATAAGLAAVVTGTASSSGGHDGTLTSAQMAEYGAALANATAADSLVGMADVASVGAVLAVVADALGGNKPKSGMSPETMVLLAPFVSAANRVLAAPPAVVQCTAGHGPLALRGHVAVGIILSPWSEGKPVTAADTAAIAAAAGERSDLFISTRADGPTVVSSYVTTEGTDYRLVPFTQAVLLLTVCWTCSSLSLL